ncbi:T9SS type A sorting domain-containing protein [Lentimicrobium sp.]|uniref:T9SS type A sorting domain-containing protein n=1 Tax=Lentimicrobium sp. TaxID=2034841 RepID=UPI0025E11442|nr:T9SS type A sorting domain-containing protein [Lentimicrobium sp.]
MRFDLLATGIDQPGNSMNSEEVLFYPNPANEVINIIAKSYTNLQIYDCHGRIVHSQPFMENGQVNISHLTSGIYIIKPGCQKWKKAAKLLNGRVRVSGILPCA